MSTAARSLLVLILLLALGCEQEKAARETTSSEPATATRGPTGSTGASEGSASASAIATTSATAGSSTSARPGDNELATADQAAVTKVFRDYQKAIGDKQGDAAADLAAARTIEYFEFVRRATLTMPEGKLRKARLMDRFMILIVRGKVPAEELRKQTGRGLFAYAVDKGMVGSEAQKVETDIVEIDGDTAYLGMRSGATTVAPRKGFQLHREQGAWKLDVMSVTPTAEPAMKDMLKNVDPDEDVAMVKVVEKLVGKPVAATIWKAPDPER